MKSLITANLTHHPGRTAASIIGVALGVILVVLTVGLVRGILRNRGERDTNTGVELLVCHRQQFGISVASLPLSLPIELMDQVGQVPGVAAITPIGQHLEMKGDNGLGLRQIDGVNFDSYTNATNIRIVEGRALPESGDAVIIDIRYAAIHNITPGDCINIFDREFKVAGIYAPETGARMMIPLATMQEETGAEGKSSMFMVKCRNADEQEAVARRITERFPDLRIIFTRDLPKLFATGYQGFNIFLDVVAGLATVISLLVISLTMYTSVMERTRQIGILKSLGASKRFIAGVFIKESLTISAIGVASGLIISLIVRATLLKTTGTKIEIEGGYVFFAIVGGLLSGLVGSIYPAIRAASQDAIEALNHE
jgi:putative ABC transport system permease protein